MTDSTLSNAYEPLVQSTLSHIAEDAEKSRLIRIIMEHCRAAISAGCQMAKSCLRLDSQRWSSALFLAQRQKTRPDPQLTLQGMLS